MRLAGSVALCICSGLLACSDGTGFHSEVEISLPAGDVVYLDGERVEPFAEPTPSVRRYVMSKEFDSYQDAEGVELVIEVVREGSTIGTLRYDAQGSCHLECDSISRLVRGLQTDPADWDNVQVCLHHCYDECGGRCSN